jgi:A/G-specific adenine glycosylase
MDPLHPGRHNQAMMELGALVCLPRDPRCIQCPVSLACAAYQSGCVNEIPGRIIRSKIKKRFLIFLIINLSHHNILIGRREGKDIWNHLYEFPVIESSSSPDIKDIPELVSGRYHIQPDEVIITRISTEIKHKLTHQHLVCRFIHMKTQNLHLLKGTKYSWIKISDFPALPIPRLIDRYITINGFF